jgi:dienelactone hydrolase
VVLPIVSGTFDRKWTPEVRARTTTRDRLTIAVKDFMRTVDYLETRPEFDMKKLGYEGLSWGAQWGPIIPAIEKRIRAVVLIGAAYWPTWPPDWNPLNYAPRITVPVLIQNGKYDYKTSVERALQPLLKLFGTPDKDKTLKLYEAGHAVWDRMEQNRDEIDFLDKVFGPAK